MAPSTPANDGSARSNGGQASTDLGFEVDRYMAAVDYIMVNSTSAPQLCPFHKGLLGQTKGHEHVDYCAVMAWLEEKGYGQSAIMGFEDKDRLSISKPCTCDAIIKARMKEARG